MRAKLIILRGLPMSGKSKMAWESFRRKGYEVVEYEHFFQQEPPQGRKLGFGDLNAMRIYDWTAEQVRRRIDEGKDVVVTAAFATRRSIRRILAEANLPKDQVEVIHVVGGIESRKYCRGTVRTAQRNWESWHGESVKQLDPSQGDGYKYARRLLDGVSWESQEEAVPAEPKKIKFHPSMIRNR